MFAQHYDTQKIKILLVEDSRREALLTQRQLLIIDDEFEIHRVGTLAEAVEKINTKPVDAVLLDLGLPDSNGTQSMQTLTKHFPDLPIVVLSGNRNEIAMVRALEHGAQEFLIKGECTGTGVRRAILNAILRKSLTTASA